MGAFSELRSFLPLHRGSRQAEKHDRLRADLLSLLSDSFIGSLGVEKGGSFLAGIDKGP